MSSFQIELYILVHKVDVCFTGIKILELCLGASHGIALTSEGALYAWGTHERTQITRPVPQLLQVLSPSFKANGKKNGMVMTVGTS